MKKKHGRKNVLIGFLIAAVLMMTVGYAALASQLNIEGISGITGNFVVKFISITEGEATGDASNNKAASVTNTTATFDVALVSPGDSMTYEIEVKNEGNLDAELDSIAGIPTYADTDAIKYTVTGVAEGDVLKAGESKKITLKVEYVDSITSQPTEDQLSKSLSMTLNYIQSTN